MAVWTVYLSLCLLFATSGSACRYGWTAYGCRCYRYFNTPHSWNRAERVCLSNGGYLASIHNQEEYMFVQSIVSSVVSTVVSSVTATWLGGHCAVSDSKWFWIDGSKMNYQLWAPGQPNDIFHRDNCLLMNWGVRPGWNDVTCSNKRPFVCAIDYY